MSERVRIAAPDRPSAERLRSALAALEPVLVDASNGGFEVLVVVKSPAPGLVFAAIVTTVGSWLDNERLASTSVQVGDQPATTILCSRDAYNAGESND